jgi:hypothetical protein
MNPCPQMHVPGPPTQYPPAVQLPGDAQDTELIPPSGYGGGLIAAMPGTSSALAHRPSRSLTT